MRYAAKVDANQDAVVSCLRAYGATVQSLAAVGKGVPDLLVGYNEQNILMEVKDGNKPPSQTRLTTDQKKWHLEWRGNKPIIVYSPDDAIDVLKSIQPAK